MPWNDGLTGVALEIAESEAPRLRVMAGPGTGKSYAMKRRVARLIEQEVVTPEEVLAVTFTRVAAQDLCSELRSIELDGIDRIRVGTLHSFCFSLLSQEDVFRHVNRQARPLLAYEKSGVMKFEGAPLIHDLHAFGAGRAITMNVKAYEAAWARMQRDLPGHPISQEDQDFERALRDWLQFHNCMLIGELVPLTLQFLRNNPLYINELGIGHVVVDEYQDLNKAEQELINILASNGDLSIVGDVDQSIYSFRHAHPDGIVEFDEHHNVVEDKDLDVCRRCPCRVVSMANSFILQNHQAGVAARVRHFPDNCQGDVSIVQWGLAEEEIEGLSQYIEFLVNETDVDPNEILVLSPRRALGAQLAREINDSGIEAYSFYPEESYDTDAAQIALAQLALLRNNEDRVALRYLLGAGSGAMEKGAYSRLRLHCEENAIAPFDALSQVVSGALSISGINRIIPKFVEIKALLEGLADIDFEALIDRVIPDDIEDLEGLRDIADSSITDVEELEVSDFIDNLMEKISHPDLPDCSGAVRVMSLHKSKGLTSRVVIITSCVEGLLPSDDAMDDEAILNEQRRLFYVGLTRCTETLVLSSFREISRVQAYQIGLTPGRGCGNARFNASQFLFQMGPNAPFPQIGDNWLHNLDRGLEQG